MPLRFADVQTRAATREQLAAEYAAIEAQLDAARPGAVREALAAWERTRRDFETWQALADLRFQQDTRNEAARAERERADALRPEATRLDTALKRRLLAGSERAAAEQTFGAHALRLWDIDISAFDPAIVQDLEEEARLAARYTEIVAAARISIDGKVVNLTGLPPYQQSPDREVRHEAERQRARFFAENGAALDALFDELVQLRHAMGRKLGQDSFTPLGYRRMRRLDYGPEEVARFRDQVAEEVVPLVAALLEQRRVAFGWDRLRAWDEAIVDPLGNPVPVGDVDHLLRQVQRMFDAMDPRLGRFYRSMVEGGFLDFENRDGKGGGGFCTAFPTHGMPFIFGSFNGTHHDVDLLVHEMGHAFQSWSSRDLPSVDLLWPTSETAETFDGTGVPVPSRDDVAVRRCRRSVSAHAPHPVAGVSALRCGGRSLPAPGLRRSVGDAGRTPRHVAGDGAPLPAMARLGRPRISGEGG
jgi:M3 family oligoendopeptidase